MNPISEFLLFNPDYLEKINSEFLQGVLAFAMVLHTLVWVLVLFFLPFKLLSWVTRKED